MAKLKEENRTMHTQLLNNLTSALFVSLRGGNAQNEENQYINTMQTCPICKTGLETLYLGLFEENGEKYERILWRCPLQPAKKCYFPMNILPMDVFWTKRTMEQMQNGVKPLPNLHLLSEHQYHLYPKLFLPNKNGRQIDVENLVKISSYLPARQRNYSSKMTIQCAVQESRSTTTNNSSVQTAMSQIGMRTLVRASQNPAIFSTSVREFFKEKLRSGELKLDAAESPAQKQNIRKQFDFCENTTAALKSHLMLEQQLMVNDNWDSEVLREGLADPISHDQSVRLKTKIRSALIRADEEEKVEKSNQEEKEKGEEKDGNEEQGKVHISNRNKRQTPRYIPLATRNKLYKNVANKIGKKNNDGLEKRKTERPKKKHYQPNEEALKQLELKRECKALTARFGVGNIPSLDTSESHHHNEDLPMHYEPIEGCFSEEGYQSGEEFIAKLSQSRIEKEHRQCSSNQTTIGSNSTWENGENKMRKMNDGKKKKWSTSGMRMGDATIGIDSNIDERIKFNQERLIREAIRKMQNQATPSSSSNSIQQNAIELSGIPHDFNEHEKNDGTGTNQLSSQFSAINYTGEQDADIKFANYDRFDKINEVEGGHSRMMDYGEADFDFGFGLESEFQTNEDGNEMGDGIFLRNLGNE